MARKPAVHTVRDPQADGSIARRDPSVASAGRPRSRKRSNLVANQRSGGG